MLVNAKVAAIECQGDEFRLAVVKAGRARPQVLELHSARAEYLDPELRFEARVAALTRILDAIKGAPAAYVYCAKCHDAVVRNIAIPFRGLRRVAAAVPFELEPHLAFPIEELMLDFKVCGEHDGETDVLALGLRRQQVEGDLAVLAAAGVQPDAISLDAAGLTALWHALTKGLKGLQAVVHLRDEGSILAITDGKRPAYFRGLNATAAEFRDSPARAAREVQHTLRAFTAQWRGGGELLGVHVSGGMPAESVETFGATLGLPVQTVDLLEAAPGGSKAAERHGASGEGVAVSSNAWASCVGAALCAAGGPFMLDFARSERTLKSGLRGVVAHLLFSSCLGLLLLLCVSFFLHQGTLQNEELAGQVAEQTAGVLKEVEALKTQGVGEGIDMDLFKDPPILDVLQEIAAKMPDTKVKVEEINIASPPRTPWITIRGTAASDELLSQVFEDLRGSTLFSVADDPGRTLEGNMTRFVIKAERSEGKSSE